MFELDYLSLFISMRTCETVQELMETTYDTFITCFNLFP